MQARATWISASVAPLLRAHASAAAAVYRATKYRMRAQDARRTGPRASPAAAEDTETVKSPWRSCCGGPVLLDHSIDPIVPHARTATTRTACIVLVCFMEASIVRLNHALRV